MSKERINGKRPIYGLLAFRAIVVVIIAAFFLSGLPNRITYPKLHWDTAKQYAGAFGIDPYLVMSLMKVESNFRVNAKSKSGAIGLMQVMPDTGRWVAGVLGTGSYYDNMLLDPDFNIMIGSWYIDHLLESYGEPAAAIAAYNGGMGNVDAWLASGTWSGKAEEVKDIPFKETSDFVNKVMNAWYMYARTYGAVK